MLLKLLLSLLCPFATTGHTGFMRGGQHVSGMTYGNLSRTTSEGDFKGETTPLNALPPSPHQTQTPVTSNPKHRLPGYTGFIPGNRATFAETFGKVTAALSPGHIA
jgi:hypothetical protein